MTSFAISQILFLFKNRFIPTIQAWYRFRYLPAHTPAWSRAPIAPLDQPDSPLSWPFRALGLVPSSANLSLVVSLSKPPKSMSRVLIGNRMTITRILCEEASAKFAILSVAFYMNDIIHAVRCVIDAAINLTTLYAYRDINNKWWSAFRFASSGY